MTATAITASVLRLLTVQVGQLWLRVLERRAKLYGLDMQPALGGAPPLTHELLAAVVGWDAAGYEALYGVPYPIDVDGEEMPQHGEALELGSGD
jgi:hypothetical protein